MSHPNPHPYGIYVHVPWCRARCPYCAFNVEVRAQDDMPVTDWLHALFAAWEVEQPHFSGPAHSLYLGGGTPSLLPAEPVGQLIDTLPLTETAEVTLEVNPGTASAEALHAMTAVGVNRMSLGVQSLQHSVARRLSRGHTTDQALELIQIMPSLPLRSWSIDLIFGVPDQTLDQLKADLDLVRELSPPHISLYGLSIEPGTPFEQMAHSGALTLPEQESWRAQYDLIVQTLTQEGWVRYEVSNFAKPGHRGVHNEQVWRGGWYAGLGPGAHGFRPDGTRTTTVPGVSEWIAQPCARDERPSPKEAAIDHLLSTLRHCNGTTHRGLLEVSGYKLSEQTIDTLCQAGLLIRNNCGIHLTLEGFAMSDGVIRRLAETLSP